MQLHSDAFAAVRFDLLHARSIGPARAGPTAIKTTSAGKNILESECCIKLPFEKSVPVELAESRAGLQRARLSHFVTTA